MSTSRIRTAPKSAAGRSGSGRVPSDVLNPKLAADGVKRIVWADGQMPVLREIRDRFTKEKPLKGQRIGACLHVTTETANLVRTLTAGGAEVFLCASNPLSTQDDVAAALAATYTVPTFAVRGENKDRYYAHIRAVLDAHPTLTLDDGADLVSVLHSERPAQLSELRGGMEETTTGLVRLRAMARDGALKYPIVAVNDAQTKFLFDNRYGTGQSTLDGIIRATNVLVAGRVFVIAGYGWCGRGLAQRARGMGARVVITEVDAIKALEATLDGFEVMPMLQAAAEGDLLCTLTGNSGVLRREHFEAMKDGAILCNSGHFNVEIDIPALEELSREIRRAVRPNVDAFRLRNGKTVYLLAEGRLVNLASAEGHPAAVMDMSFATQALTAEWIVGKGRGLKPGVHPVPIELEQWIAQLKLKTLGVRLDQLTEAQKRYMTSWQEGT